MVVQGSCQRSKVFSEGPSTSVSAMVRSVLVVVESKYYLQSTLSLFYLHKFEMFAGRTEHDVSTSPVGSQLSPGMLESHSQRLQMGGGTGL